MGAPRAFTGVDKAEMLRLRLSGAKYAAIAERFGCTPSTVSVIVRGLGAPISVEHHGAAPADKQARKLTGYTNWTAMVQRCTNPNSRGWSGYGGRGITVHQPWLDSFAEFIKDLGPRPSPRHSLDRFPNRSGNYEPGNVRWATGREQTANRDVTLRVGDVPLAEAAKEVGVAYPTARRRLRAGLDIQTPQPRPRRGICTEPGCGREHMARGLCSKHYRRSMGMGRKDYPGVSRVDQHAKAYRSGTVKP